MLSWTPAPEAKAKCHSSVFAVKERTILYLLVSSSCGLWSKQGVEAEMFADRKDHFPALSFAWVPVGRQACIIRFSLQVVRSNRIINFHISIKEVYLWSQWTIRCFENFAKNIRQYIACIKNYRWPPLNNFSVTTVVTTGVNARANVYSRILTQILRSDAVYTK